MWTRGTGSSRPRSVRGFVCRHISTKHATAYKCTYTTIQPQVGVAVSCLRALLHPSSHTTVNTNTRRRQQQQAEGPGSIVMGMGVYGMGVEDEGGAALLATLLHRLDFWGAQKNMTTRV